MPAHGVGGNVTPGYDNPVQGGAAVTPADGTDVPSWGRVLYIGVTGDVKVTTPDGSVLTFKAAPVGWLSVTAARVWATGTTATNILTCW